MEKKNEIPERNTGLDLLRIISMIMVIMLHYLGKGKLLDINNVYKVNHILFSLLESLSIVAVNCYVLISGYFLVKSEFKFKKFLKLWGEVVFYSIAVYIVVVLLGLKQFSISDAIKSCFPIITERYWFVNSYLAMYLLSPYLNKLIYALSQKEYKNMLLILIILFSVLTVLPSDYLLDQTGGYGIIWFVCLYLIAGYIRLHVTEDTINKYKNKYLLFYIVSSILTAIGFVVLKYLSVKLNVKDISEKLLFYNMPLVLISSVFLFLYFNTIKIKNKNINNIILKIAPLTFAVYLIHEQFTLRTVLYKNILHTEICYHNPYAIFIIIGSVFAIFIVCILIEYIRRKTIDFIINKTGRK